MTEQNVEVPPLAQRIRFSNWSISSKILTVMLLVSLVPLAFATYFIVRNSQRALTAETEANLSLLSRSMALRFAHILDDHLDFLKLVAMNPDLAEFTQGDEATRARLQHVADATVKSLLAADPSVDVVGIYTAQGETLAHTDPAAVGRNVAARDFIASALGGRPFMSSLRRDFSTGALGVNLSVPILEDNHVVGALALRVGSDLLTRVYSETLTTETNMHPSSSISAIDMYVADPHGIVLANSADPKNVGFVLGALPESELDAAMASAPLGTECPEGQPDCAPADRVPVLPVEYAGLQPLGMAVATALRINDVSSVRYCVPNDPTADSARDNCSQVWRVAAAAPVRSLVTNDVDAPDDLFGVIVDTPESAFMEAATRQRNLALLIAGLTALGAILCSALLARALARPINQLARAARHIAAGEPHSSDDLDSVANRYDEIGALARALTSMLHAQQDRIDELNMIYQVGRQVTSSVNVNDTLRFLADSIRPIIPYDGIEISVRGPSGALQRQYPPGGRDEEPVAYNPHDGLIGLANSAQEGLRIADLSAGPLPPGEPERTWSSLSPRSWLGVLLQGSDEPVGVVELVSRQPNAYTELDQRLLASISLQAAVAIQNASEVREREEKYVKQIMELNIEIDEMKRTQQVGEIVESEYFRNLSAQAQRMRAQRHKSS